MSLDQRDFLRGARRNPIGFVPARRVVSIYPGEWPSPFEGKGFEPLRFRDFQIGDDPRRIHAPTTARRGTPMIGERVALRDFRIMVVVDRSPSMLVREKPAIQVSAAALLLYSAWQAETSFGLAVRDGANVVHFGMGIGARHFHHLYKILYDLLLGEGRTPRGTSLPLSRAFAPNTMLLYCSDFLDARGDLVDTQALLRQTRRYDFVPVVIQDELESAFPVIAEGSFIPFVNPETGLREEVWLSKRETERLRAAHQKRFAALTEAFERRGGAIHLAAFDMRTTEKRFNAFFRQRPRR